MKAVVTVSGADRTGIIAVVSTYLYENGINIEDISQTVMGDHFAMIMRVDLSGSGKDIATLAAALEHKGGEIGMSIRLQHEAIFDAMHRV